MWFPLWFIQVCKIPQFLAKGYQFRQLTILFQKVVTLWLPKIYIMFCPTKAKYPFFQAPAHGLIFFQIVSSPGGKSHFFQRNPQSRAEIFFTQAFHTTSSIHVLFFSCYSTECQLYFYLFPEPVVQQGLFHIHGETHLPVPLL